MTRPLLTCLLGLTATASLFAQAPGDEGIPAGAVVLYTFDEGENAFIPFCVDVLTLEGDRIKEVTAFLARTEEIPDDWHERWKAFHRPVEVAPGSRGGPGLRVRPPWEPARGVHPHRRYSSADGANLTSQYASTPVCPGVRSFLPPHQTKYPLSRRTRSKLGSPSWLRSM